MDLLEVGIGDVFAGVLSVPALELAKGKFTFPPDSPDKRHPQLFQQFIQQILSQIEQLQLKRKRDDEKIQALKELNEKIFKLEERLMNNEIEASTYKTWFQKFKEEKAVLEYQLNGIKKTTVDNSDDIVERFLPNLGNLYEIYEKGNITQKHTLIRRVFKDSLLWVTGHLEPLL